MTEPMIPLADALASAASAGEIPVTTTTPREVAAENRRAAQLAARAEGPRRAAEYWRAIANGEPVPDVFNSRIEFDGDRREDGLPACATCRGARKLRRDVGPLEPGFGTLLPCPACLRDPATASGLAARSGLAAGLEQEQLGQTFASFRPCPLSRAAFEASRSWASDPQGWLHLWGEPGSGKSHLGAAVVNDLSARGRPCRYWYAPDLIAAARRAVGAGGNALDAFVGLQMDLPVLVLDDLGAVKLSDFALGDVLEPLLDRRYRARRATLLLSIGPPSAVKDAISESIGRRLEDPSRCKVVQNKAPQWGTT